MKPILLILSLIFCLTAGAQEKPDTLSWPACRERGHIVEKWEPIPWGSYSAIVDLPQKTIRVNHHSTDNMMGYCDRCGRRQIRKGSTKPDTVIIWRKR